MARTDRTTAPALTRPLLASYGVMGLPLAVLALPVYVYLPTLYTQELGLSLTLVATVIFATRLFDGISDPLIGWLSDHTSSRFGRRKPWIFGAVPLTMVAAYFLFVPPENAGIAHLALFSLMLTIAWTALTLPFNAWGAELTGDYNGRTRVTAARQIFALIGTMVAAGLPAVMTAYGITAVEDHVRALALALLILLPLAAAISLWRVPERPPLTRKSLPVIEGLLYPLRNAAFRRLVIAFLINAVANGLPVTLFIPFVTHRIGAPEAYGPLLFAYFLAGLAAIPVWAFVAQKIGKHRGWSIAMLWACAAFIWTPFFVGTGDLTLFVVITILSGFGVGADLAIPAAILADVVDKDTAESGEERTGFYFALWGLVSKIALGVAAALAFLPLDWAGFNADADTNTEFALMTLALLYAGLPVVLKVIAVSVMWGFPLTAESQKALRDRLESSGA